MALSGCFEIESWSRPRRALLGCANYTCGKEGHPPTSSRPFRPFQNVASGLVGPYPATYDTPATLGFISNRFINYECLRSGWALFQALPWVYLGLSQWRGGIVRLESSDSLSLSRTFTTTRWNHSTRLLRLFEPIWNIHSNKEESFDSTSQTSWAYLEHLQQREGIVRLDSSDPLCLSEI